VSGRKVVIAGGGVTGLTTAYRLLARIGAGPFDVTIVEARGDLGGNIRTERTAGFVVDGGPDSFVTAKPHATALCKELGLGDRLIGTRPESRKVYVGHQGKLHRLPEGIMLTVPTRWLPVAKSGLLTWPGKARMALDLILPRAKDGADESIGHFVRRRLGAEALDRIAEPLLGGIYAGDVDTLSLRSTFPQLADLEAKHGSLVRGALAQLAARRPRAPGEAEPSIFYSLLGGMGELVQALAQAVTRAGARVRKGARVVSVRHAGKAGRPRFLVTIESDAGGEVLEADDVVLTTPAYAAAEAVEPVAADASVTLREIPYVSTGTIALAFARADVPHPLDAVGVILPRSAGRKILATTFISSKWSGRAPSDAALLRVFVGGHRDPTALDKSDDELVAIARSELASMLSIQQKPLFARVFRYARSNPQPTIGHAARLRRLADVSRREPGLHFAGAAFDGVGIPDCVRQANEVAERVIASAR
jgi:oxygen-dependent protoporphyrinogen oxidase